MSRFNLRQKPRISYYEPDEPNLDEYVFCDGCGDHVYEYCSIHGPLLVVPDDKVPVKTNFPSYVPRAALTIPHVFLHIAPSIIPGAGLGVFTTLTLPRGVRFGPYRGQRCNEADSQYCWQIYDRNNRPSHIVDAADPDRSNWMRYVNCSRHWFEQNLVAYQYQGELYYRTIKIIPRFTELMVFYGSEFASTLKIDLKNYNSPLGYAQKLGAPTPKKPKVEDQILKEKALEQRSTEEISSLETCANCDDTQKSAGNKLKTDKDSKKESNKKSIIETYTKLTRNDKKNENNFITLEPCISSDKNNNLKNLSCDICEYTTNTENELTSHLKAHASLTPYICDLCLYRTVIKNELISHVKTHLVKKVGLSNRCLYKENARNFKLIRTIERPYACKTCGKYFNRLESLKTHIRTHTGEKPYACKTCGKCFNVLHHLKTHIRTHTGEKPHACKTCGKCFNELGNLKKHIRTHTGEKPYACKTCGKCFNVLHHLKTHIRTHTGEKPHACKTCGKCFNELGNLKKHIRTHTGEKPYACKTCGKCFNVLGSLKTHIRTHTGEKPYACKTCGKCFNVLGNLKKHIRTHTGEKPYACKTCGKCFNVLGSLKTHIRTHTGEKPYACKTCGKCFNVLGSLKTHIRTHTGEKPYACKTCGKCFNQLESLKKHIRTHTGEKPYACKTCGKCFTHSCTLRTHNKTHIS